MLQSILSSRLVAEEMIWRSKDKSCQNGQRQDKDLHPMNMGEVLGLRREGDEKREGQVRDVRQRLVTS